MLINKLNYASYCYKVAIGFTVKTLGKIHFEILISQGNLKKINLYVIYLLCFYKGKKNKK